VIYCLCNFQITCRYAIPFDRDSINMAQVRQILLSLSFFKVRSKLDQIDKNDLHWPLSSGLAQHVNE
jgi:hypothetical protein